MLISLLAALARGGIGPVVVVGGAVLLATHDPGGVGELTTAQGRRLQLHSRGSYAALHRHHLRLHGDDIHARITAGLARDEDPLGGFLALARRYRDLSTGAQPRPGSLPGVQMRNGAAGVLDALIGGPPPAIPDPCVIDDGVYPLSADRPRWFTRRPHVLLHPRRQLWSTRSRFPVCALEAAAEADLEEALARSAGSLPPGLSPRCLPELTRARAEIDRTGVVRRNALLYLPEPGRLGHLLPAGFRTHGRTSSGKNIAVTIPWPGALDPAELRPYWRLRDGRWELFPLRHGICLGAGPPPDRITNPDPLTAPLYLRWAAGRVATNKGRFHEND